MVKRMWLSLVLLPLMAAGAFAQDGLTFQFSNGKVSGEKVTYMPGMLRAESQDGRRVTIVRLDKNMVYTLNTQTRTYNQFSLEQLSNRLKREEDRTSAKADEGTQAGRRNMAQVLPTGETKTIQGINCTKYVVRRGSGDSAIVWTTQDVKNADVLRSDLKKVTSQFAGLTDRFGLQNVQDQITGFPMEIDHGDRTFRITEVENTAASPQVFQVPSGYTMRTQQENNQGNMKGQGNTGQSEKDREGNQPQHPEP